MPYTYTVSFRPTAEKAVGVVARIRGAWESLFNGSNRVSLRRTYVSWDLSSYTASIVGTGEHGRSGKIIIHAKWTVRDPIYHRHPTNIRQVHKNKGSSVDRIQDFLIFPELSLSCFRLLFSFFFSNLSFPRF